MAPITVIFEFNPLNTVIWRREIGRKEIHWKESRSDSDWIWTKARKEAQIKLWKEILANSCSNRFCQNPWLENLEPLTAHLFNIKLFKIILKWFKSGYKAKWWSGSFRPTRDGEVLALEHPRPDRCRSSVLRSSRVGCFLRGLAVGGHPWI